MSEHAEQVLLFSFARMQEPRHPELRLMFAIPNAGGYSGGFKSNVARVVRMKREGLKPGVPDVCLPVARGGFHALYIEMKRLKPRMTKTKGMRYDATKQTPEQIEWMDRLSEAGNLVAVCTSAQEAQATVMAYLHGEIVRQAAA